MIRCWINERCSLSNGQIIRVLNGYDDHSFGFRISRFYNLSIGQNYASWEDNSRRSVDNPFVGMVTNIDIRSNDVTYFDLLEVIDGLPPFNTEGRLLTKTFISSRINGLEADRSQCALGIYEADSQPIYWEGFPAESRPAEEVMIDRLDECHIYVGIFGAEYSEPTILEYRRAQELERERLCFVKNIDGREQQLTDFLNEIRDSVVYRRFSSSDQLRVLVRDAVINAVGNLFE